MYDNIYYKKTIESAVSCGVCWKPCTPHTTVPYFSGTATKAIHWKCLKTYFIKELAEVEAQIKTRMIGGGRRNASYPNGL